MDVGILHNIIVECWKSIKGFPSYLISNRGRVWSLQRVEKWDKYYRTRQGRFLIPRLGKQGYLYVGLCKNGKVYTKKLHRLVAENFMPNPYGYSVVNHRDEDRTNNDVNNLEWCTTTYNVTYGGAIGKRQGSLINSGWSKSVCKYTKDGILLAKFVSISEAARSVLSTQTLDGARGAICSCCRGKRKSYCGFIWKYEEDCLC